jgi:hypothetical protein
LPITLRRIVDLVAITAATAVVSGAGWHAYAHFDHQRELKRTSDHLRRFQQVIAFQSASAQTETNTRGWPVTVDPGWFGSELPQNNLTPDHRPWLEVAPREQAHLSDPPIRMAIDPSVAAFWYNPYSGVIRARVPMQISDERTLELYNRVNQTSLRSIHGDPLPYPTMESERETERVIVEVTDEAP